MSIEKTQRPPESEEDLDADEKPSQTLAGDSRVAIAIQDAGHFRQGRTGLGGIEIVIHTPDKPTKMFGDVLVQFITDERLESITNG